MNMNRAASSCATAVKLKDIHENFQENFDVSIHHDHHKMVNVMLSIFYMIIMRVLF